MATAWAQQQAFRQQPHAAYLGCALCPLMRYLFLPPMTSCSESMFCCSCAEHVNNCCFCCNHLARDCDFVIVIIANWAVLLVIVVEHYRYSCFSNASLTLLVHQLLQAICSDL